MTKKELYEKVLGEVVGLCDEVRVPNKVRDGLVAIIEENLKPKACGARVNIEEVTRRDEAGNITHIMCSLSGKFLPATKEFFYEDKNGKGIEVNGAHLKRLSRQAEAIRKQFIKQLNATEKAIMADILDGNITPEEGKEKLAEVRAAKPDYSKVTDALNESE